MIARGPRRPTRPSTSRSPTCATGPPADAEPVDVLVSNATLQWVPGHLDLLPGAGRPGRARAAGSRSRCPATSTSRATRSATELAAERAVRRPHRAASPCPRSHDPAVYLDALAGLGCEVDAWETTYLHVLTGPDPVFTWVSGTGARPTLQALPDDLRPRLRGGVQARGCAAAYPRARRPRRAAVPPGLRRRAAGLAAGREAAPRPGRRARPAARTPPAGSTPTARADRGREAGTSGARGGAGSVRTTPPGASRPSSTSASRSRSSRRARPIPALLVDARSPSWTPRPPGSSRSASPST